MLTDEYTRKLLGDDGYVTVLFETRLRNVMSEVPSWTMVTELLMSVISTTTLTAISSTTSTPKATWTPSVTTVGLAEVLPRASRWPSLR